MSYSKVKAGPVHGGRLRSFVERIERVAAEIKALQGDVRDLYAEAKGVGYDVGTMRKVVRLRAMDEADRAEQETLLDVYWHALEQPDRIDARLEAGESQREAAKAEGVSKSTVQRRGPKTKAAPATSEMDHLEGGEGRDGWRSGDDPETGEIEQEARNDGRSSVEAGGSDESTGSGHRAPIAIGDNGRPASLPQRAAELSDADDRDAASAGPDDVLASEDRGEPAEPLGASGSQMVCGLTNGTPAASIPAEPDLTIPDFLKAKREGAMA